MTQTLQPDVKRPGNVFLDDAFEVYGPDPMAMQIPCGTVLNNQPTCKRDSHAGKKRKAFALVNWIRSHFLFPLHQRFIVKTRFRLLHTSIKW
jgi:hypothetical protein